MASFLVLRRIDFTLGEQSSSKAENNYEAKPGGAVKRKRDGSQYLILVSGDPLGADGEEAPAERGEADPATTLALAMIMLPG